MLFILIGFLLLTLKSTFCTFCSCIFLRICHFPSFDASSFHHHLLTIFSSSLHNLLISVDQRWSLLICLFFVHLSLSLVICVHLHLPLLIFAPEHIFIVSLCHLMILSPLHLVTCGPFHVFTVSYDFSPAPFQVHPIILFPWHLVALSPFHPFTFSPFCIS